MVYKDGQGLDWFGSEGDGLLRRCATVDCFGSEGARNDGMGRSNDGRTVEGKQTNRYTILRTIVFQFQEQECHNSR